MADTTSSTERVVRTWGPFSGRQLTTIIVAAIAAIALVPSAVYAVDTFTNVAIQDPTTGSKAKVDSQGSQIIAGTVTARPAPISSFVRGRSGIGACTPLITPDPGRALVITSLHVNVYANPTPGFGNNILIYRGPGCTNLIDVVNPAGIGVTTLDYGNGFTIPAGSALSANRQNNVQAEVYAFGYSVLSSQVPAGLAAAGAQESPTLTPNGVPAAGG